MGGLVNLIKKLFSGIFSFVGGFLGGKKSNGGYYLELSDSEAGKPAPAKAESTEAKPAEAAPVTTPEPAKVEAATVAATNNSAKAEPAKVDVAATNGSKPTAPANPLNLPEPTVSFASEYLAPKPSNSRRRPGANMSAYLEMAKGMKTSNN